MAQKDGASVPLLRNAFYDIREAYGTESCAKFMEGSEVVTDYEPKKLASFRVCCVRRGTILMNPVLFVEQTILTCVFFAFATTSYLTAAHYAATEEPEIEHAKGIVGNTSQDMMEDPSGANASQGMEFLWLATRALATHGLATHAVGTHRLGFNLYTFRPVTIKAWIQRQEPKMRAFCQILTGLAAFLMALYTSTTVGRWWIIRTQGIGGIKAATVDLEWCVCQFVTQNENVLSAIRRYGRASLQLVFLWRREGQSGPLSEETKKELMQSNGGMLTEDEVAKLNGLSHCLHETIWAWQFDIVTMLRKEGKIKSGNLYQLLIDHCEEGRKAVQCIHTFLAVRIPMQYVHVLGFLIKMHNLILAVIMGLLFGVTFEEGQFIICVQLFGRTLLLPFLFNAILLIDAELSDPFEGTGNDDFPVTNLIHGLEADCKNFVKATNHMPKWILDRAKLPKEDV